MVESKNAQKLKFSAIQWRKTSPVSCIEISFVHRYKQVVIKVG